MQVEQIEITEGQKNLIHKAMKWQIMQDMLITSVIAVLFLLYLLTYDATGSVTRNDPLYVIAFLTVILIWMIVETGRCFRDLQAGYLIRLSNIRQGQLSVRIGLFLFRHIVIKGGPCNEIAHKLVAPTVDQAYLLHNIENCTDLTLVITPHRRLIVDITGQCDSRRLPDIFYMQLPVLKIICVIIFLGLLVMTLLFDLKR